jgi:hypothetical protein
VAGKSPVIVCSKMLHHSLRLQIDLAGVVTIFLETDDTVLIGRVDADVVRKKRGFDQSFFFLRQVYDDQGILQNVIVNEAATREQDVFIRVEKFFMGACQKVAGENTGGN